MSRRDPCDLSSLPEQSLRMDGFLLCWYLLTALSLIFLIYDMVTTTPVPWVMGVAWVLVFIYTGPLGLFIYFLSCRQPFPGSHDEFIKPHWKQALGSEIHCVAGDATAIIVAAGILHYFELPNGIDAIIEYIAAWIFGLFIFQALFMINMFPSYWAAVRATIFAETVSMNFVMIAMIPTVMIFRSLYPTTSDPLRPYFWGVMSLATILAFIIGYPANSWLVRRGLKHGMLSRATAPSHPGYIPPKETAHHEHHEPAKIGVGPALWHVSWSFALLVIVIWIVSIWIPVCFTYACSQR
jgi:hypothetical protein